MNRNLTNPKFGKGHAGATDTEKRNSNAKFNQGGKDSDHTMFKQQAAVAKTRGHVGPKDVRGPARVAPLAGPPDNRRGQSKVGVSAPAGPGRTGNVHGSTPRKPPAGV
jgi:hypothetical protein